MSIAAQPCGCLNTCLGECVEFGNESYGLLNPGESMLHLSMDRLSPGFKALTTEDEQKEALAVGKAPMTLRYRGRMEWMVKMGHDGRIWDVLGADGEYATLTLDGLRDRGLIK